MTFSATAPAGVLAKAFSMAGRVAPKSNGAAIITNLKMSARRGKLIVVGTDTNAELEVCVDAEASGEVCAPAAALTAIASRLDADKPLSMEVKSDGIVLKQGRYRSTLPVLPAKDFPPSMRVEDGVSLDVESAVLAAALRNIADAAADNMITKPNLSGAYLDFKGDVPMLTCADTTGIGSAPLGEDKPPKGEGVIIPPPAFSVLMAMAPIAERMTLTAGKWLLEVSAGSITYRTKIIEGPYVDWRRVVRKKHASQIRVSGDALRRAVDKLTAIGPGALAFNFDKTIKIEAKPYEKNASGASAADVLSHESMSGPAVTLSLSSEMTKWIVRSLPGAETIEIGIEDADSNVAFLDPARPRDVRIVMPLRTL